ncbi:MAG: histidine--tRNA ligase [Candidatus Aegiribacteria sp.]|nr:histidine--tRNA ligase [Candidatus Aegiribacteria sp.]
MTLSKKPLKGMRELTPAEKRVEDYIVGKLREAGAVYGFEEYETPVLEPLELFLAKSGNELAVKQSYNFPDKGGRKLIMRPELTPSLARMVAAAGELIYPVKWMSFPVCYRYERPQRGRVREFMQFNLDILGVSGLDAELEVFLVLRRIMNSLGASPGQYIIRYSSRRLASEILSSCGMTEEEMAQAYAVIDKKDKLKPDEWEELVRETVKNERNADTVMKFASCSDPDSSWLRETAGGSEAYDELVKFSGMLKYAGITEAQFDAGVVRGLDYYTGIVFEVSDTGSKNRRAICGGGRYDNLVGMFGGQKVTGVGFGLGLLTLELFLKTYDLIPGGISGKHPVDIFLAVYSDEERTFAVNLAEKLRNAGVSVEIDITGKNLSKQFKIADRKLIGYVAVIGPVEAASGRITLKNMISGTETECEVSEVPGILIEGNLCEEAN